MKKVELLLDENNYVCSYGVIMTPVLINTSDEENIYAESSLDNSITMEINDEDMEAFSYVYSAYHVVNGEVVFDKNKSTEVYEGNVIEPMPTIQDLMLQIEALNKRINELTNDTNNV